MTPDDIAAHLARFIAPDQFTELRALNCGGRGKTFAGFYRGDRLRDLARQALAVTRQSSGVYFIPSPIHPQRAATRLNRALDVYKGFSLTTDDDIIERRFLLVDLDPRRLWLEKGADSSPGQDAPSSARELAWTRRIADRHVRPYLAAVGLASPIVACSGNGVHLVYQLAPSPGGKCGANDPAAKLLRTLDERFSCYGLRIDPNTFNPCRMLKVPGTLSRKGTATTRRPYRTARILEIPHDWKQPAAVGIDIEPAPAVEPEPVRVAEPVRSSRPDRTGMEQRPAAKPAAKPAKLFDAGHREDRKPSH